jgi:hypothetical protein
MFTLTNRFLILLVFCQVIISSCKRDGEQVTPTNQSSKQEYPAERIILGKKLENPYTVNNMQQAYKNIISGENNKTISEDIPVRVTHLYLRFLPKDWNEYDNLKSDTVLKLYQIPLDYELKTYGNVYHDPSIPEDKPTWQYTSVAVDYAFNKNIHYEILSELYLPEVDSTLLESTENLRISGKSFIDALVDEAMILTKNYSDTLKTDYSNMRTTFNPSGIVAVFDTRLNKLIPLQGVKMRARRWFDTRETTTNADGWYQTSGFKREANYSLVFETNHFDIRTGTFGQATIDGPKSDNPWNVILWDGVNRFYSHVFRGAYRYHYGDIGGLKKPNLGFKLKYAAFDKSGSAQGVNIGNWSLFSTNPNILIYRKKDGGSEYASDEIFSTTCHETCHTTHMQIMNAGLIQYSQVNTFIAESWPVAVEWFITSIEYRSRGIANYGSDNYSISASYPLDRAYQYWQKTNSPNYTSVFIDLVDNYNQYNFNFIPYGKSTVNDQVTGYSLSGIESTFLKHVYGLSSLKSNLKNHKPSGITDSQIDLLINSF